MSSNSTAYPSNRGRLILRLLFDSPSAIERPRVPCAGATLSVAEQDARPRLPAVLPRILEAPRALDYERPLN